MAVRVARGSERSACEASLPATQCSSAVLPTLAFAGVRELAIDDVGPPAAANNEVDNLDYFYSVFYFFYRRLLCHRTQGKKHLSER